MVKKLGKWELLLWYKKDRTSSFIREVPKTEWWTSFEASSSARKNAVIFETKLKRHFNSDPAHFTRNMVYRTIMI